MIDALGGIDINVEEAENGIDIIPYLNNYVVEVIKIQEWIQLRLRS